jgi:DNA-binding GntR family transcriptional regulator
MSAGPPRITRAANTRRIRSVDRAPLSQVIAEQLRSLILGLDLPPGTPLRMTELAAELGVSVMPVREAIRSLEAEDLVTFAPRRGAVVSQVSGESIEELYAVRAALESLAAKIGASSLTVDELDSLTRRYAAMEECQAAGDLDGFINADHAFHSVVYRASHRAALIRKIDQLYERSRRVIPAAYGQWLPVNWAAAAHGPLLRAAIDRDSMRLERLTRNHMLRAGERISRGYPGLATALLPVDSGRHP